MATHTHTSTPAGILSDEHRERREEIIAMLTKAYWMEIEARSSTTTG